MYLDYLADGVTDFAIVIVNNDGGPDPFQIGTYVYSTDPPLVAPILQASALSMVWWDYEAVKEDWWIISRDGLVTYNFTKELGTWVDILTPDGFEEIKGSIDKTLALP